MVVYIDWITAIFSYGLLASEQVGIEEAKKLNDFGEHITTMGLMTIICGTLLWGLIKLVKILHKNLQELKENWKSRAEKAEEDLQKARDEIVRLNNQTTLIQTNHEKELLNILRELKYELRN